MMSNSTSPLPRWRQKIQISGLIVSLILLILSISYAATQMQKEKTVIAQTDLRADLRGKVRAPELNGGLGWLNVDQPVRLADLKGKIVLLDFWTYCCINCMHIIPDLKKLEKKYSSELVVIGIHSAKFLNEKETDNIRSAILRYEIEHPVVNDANFVLWKAYGARGWPHLVLIDPEGYIVGTVSGEGNYEILDRSIQDLVRQYSKTIIRKPIPLSLEKDKQAPSLLSFPGKILADEKSQRLFISDSNHNRIVISDFSGKVLDIAGTGTIGKADGSFDQAEFNHPQGLALQGNHLFVADTENHLIRSLDLEKRSVIAIAGVGEQAQRRDPGGPALRTPLNSPWDLEILDDGPQIYIAMAGPHQLWIYDPSDKTVRSYVGSGREDIVDGFFNSAALAQPSGLSSDGQNLYFADSEVSALRWVDRSQKAAQVKTFIGKGLFDFGDRDGAFDQALLQHPLAVQYHQGKVYIADTYNHKIKIADLQSQTIATLVGNGKPGVGSPQSPQFNEPGGLSLAGNLLYVADTNNHAIRVVNLETKRVETVMFDLSNWTMNHQKNHFDVFGNPDLLTLNDRKFFADGSVEITMQFPSSYHLNPAIQPIIQCKFSVSGKEWIGPKLHPDVIGNSIQFSLPKSTLENPQKLDIAITYYYCREDNQGQCSIGSILVSGPLQSGTQRISLSYTLPSQVN